MTKARIGDSFISECEKRIFKLNYGGGLTTVTLKVHISRFDFINNWLFECCSVYLVLKFKYCEMKESEKSIECLTWRNKIEWSGEFLSVFLVKFYLWDCFLIKLSMKTMAHVLGRKIVELIFRSSYLRSFVVVRTMSIIDTM